MRSLLLGIAFVSVAFAQSKPGGLRFFFNGAGVEMRTESSGGTSPLSTAGSIVVGPPAHRAVLDKDDNLIFAYDIEVKKLADGRVAMRIGPVDPAKTVWTGAMHKLTGPIPTLSAWRDFPPLNLGDEVQVDIMYRPSTGEKLWDVLKIIEDRESYPRSPTGERFSFERFAVTIDGKVVAERQNVWMIGRALKMHLPGYGDYYIVLTPTPDFPFQTGWVDHNKLRFKADGKQVEIEGKSNILQHSDFGTVWFLHETGSDATERRMKFGDVQITTPAGASGGEFICGDNLDQIYPKEQRKKE